MRKHISTSFAAMAGGALGALAFGAPIATAQNTAGDPPADHAHHAFTHTTRAAIPLNPHIVCGDTAALYQTQSECYGLFAGNITAYAKEAAAPYMAAHTPQEAAEILEKLQPDEIRIEAGKNTVTAFFRNESGQLHNPQGPAYIKIDLGARSYTHIRQINGNFASDADTPSYVKYTQDQSIAMQWDGAMGSHNPYGPAFVLIEPQQNLMKLDWAINGVATSLDCEIGLTSSQVNLDTGIAFVRETASGSVADMQRRMHRNDGLHMWRVDPQTGGDLYRIYRFHDDAVDSDEISIEYFYNEQTHALDHQIWALNGEEIPKIENYVPPAMTHHGRMHCMMPQDADTSGHNGHDAATHAPAP